MDNDLSDVALDALETLESQDDDGAAEENTSETSSEATEQSETTEAEENTEVEENNAEEGSGEATDEENSGDEEETAEQKKELSDEEFEKMAKARGYSKQEQKQNTSEQDAIAKLLERPNEIEENIWQQMPEENKITYNALPYIEAKGKNGSVYVKIPEQLPDDFEFANKKAEKEFDNDMVAQENKATNFKQAIVSRRERANAEVARREQARMIIDEISSLQKNGTLPTPTAKNGTPQFDNDPAVLLINKVLQLRAERANAGYNLSIADATAIYKAQHPEDFIKKEAKGDAERANIAKKVAGNSKSSGTAVNKDDDKNKPQYYKTGMSTEDVLDRILDDME